MGNTVRRTTDYLRDPYLVRRIQEGFGVHQIVIPPQSNHHKSSGADGGKTGNGSAVANGGVMNGGLDWMPTVRRSRRQLRCSMSNTTPPLSPGASDSDSSTPDLPNVITVESIPPFRIWNREYCHGHHVYKAPWSHVVSLHRRRAAGSIQFT